MRWIVLSLVVVAGLLTVAVSVHYALQDWAALNREYARFERVSAGNADLRSVIVTEGHQNAFRINVFADGTWVLLGAILAAIGIHGLCVLPRTQGRGEAA
jgi:hypothetical protein